MSFYFSNYLNIIIGIKKYTVKYIRKYIQNYSYNCGIYVCMVSYAYITSHII